MWDAGRRDGAMAGIHEQPAQPRVPRDERERVRAQLDVDGYGHASGAHRAEQRLDVLRPVEGEDADAVATAQAARCERVRHGVARGVQLVVADRAQGVGTGEIDDRRETTAGVPGEERADVDGGAGHGRTSTLPKT